MPELPEVETIRLGLEKYLVGKKILDVEVYDNKLLQSQLLHLKGARVVGVRRFGKGLVIDLDNIYLIAAHIKLTGQFIYQGPETKKNVPSQNLVGALPNKFTRLIFRLSNNSNLYFNDVRKFAWVKIIKTTNLKTIPFFKDLGP